MRDYCVWEWCLEYGDVLYDFNISFKEWLESIRYNACLALHCVKGVQIRSFFWSVFSRIRTEHEDLPRKSPHSVEIRENKNQEKLRIRTLFTQWKCPNNYLFLKSQKSKLLQKWVLFEAFLLPWKLSNENFVYPIRQLDT